ASDVFGLAIGDKRLDVSIYQLAIASGRERLEWKAGNPETDREARAAPAQFLEEDVHSNAVEPQAAKLRGNHRRVVAELVGRPIELPQDRVRRYHLLRVGNPIERGGRRTHDVLGEAVDGAFQLRQHRGEVNVQLHVCLHLPAPGRGGLVSAAAASGFAFAAGVKGLGTISSARCMNSSSFCRYGNGDGA